MQRTILITGSTDGIGYQTAEMLAREGHRVLLHGRSSGSVDKAKIRLLRELPKAEVEVFPADLSSLAEVRALAERVRAAHPRLDGLINNAGIYQQDRVETTDGLELTFAVNFLATFLLCELLRPSLQLGGDGRIVNVSSMAHRMGNLDFSDLQLRRGYDAYRAYANSKLAQVVYTAELARRLGPGSALKANSLHPGVVSTKLLVQGMGARGPDSLEQGAATSVFLATDPSVLQGGGYYVRSRLASVHPAAADPTIGRKLYDAALKLAGMGQGT
ncbi:MAG TPA: SDR family oxidoreductase [Myxococcota bacterium]|nr:SDR family oxidoreductase [Myxococcota bacterium]